jgi:hypothetical protein
MQFLAAAMLCASLAGHAADPDINPSSALHAKFAELRNLLKSNQFQKPLHLDSSESSDGVKGDIYALIDHPFAVAAPALNTAGEWCEILILHVNTKYCRASAGGRESVLKVSIGKKYDQPLDEAFAMEFQYRVAVQTANYLQVSLHADQGPLSTRNYRIVLEAVPLDGGRTFIHLGYSYSFGIAGRIAMQIYLGTTGRNKVGFTVEGTQADGQTRHIGGMRGLVERNTMRYYLAIEAFLGALAEPPRARLEKRLRDWFAAVERYPRQLHEMEQREYLEMKRKEYLRQQA